MFNRFLTFSQNKLNLIYENSLFLQNIDKLIFVSILSVFLASTFAGSDTIGFIALITIFLTIVKLLSKPNEKLTHTSFEIWLIAYFMIVIVSLAGSTLFALSLKGFLKTVTYLGFYLSVVQFLKNNMSKLPWIIGTIALSVSIEGVIGFLQSFRGLDEISTWQDTSNLNPEEVMSRVYGSLKPYNPNLLGGYFVAGISSLFGMAAYFLTNKKYKVTLLAGILSVISIYSLFSTGCRGSYLGLMAIVVCIFAISAKYFWNNYKKIYMAVVGSCVVFFTTAILLISSLRARVLSIFAMRQDSSNSFRFNVYQSSFDMFKDNWLLGIGLGNQNFREIYGLYMKTGFDALSAYNVFLETAVESGIFALVAFLGFLITALMCAVKYIQKSDNINNVIFISIASVSIIGLMVHGLVDTVFFRPQIQFIFWTMMAVISVITQKEAVNC